MSDFLQGSELVWVGEHDPGERLAVYLAFEDDPRPSSRDRGQGFVRQDSMPNGIGVDGADTARRQ